MDDLEELCAFSLAPPATKSITPTLIARSYKHLKALFSAIYEATVFALTCPSPGAVFGITPINSAFSVDTFFVLLNC